MPDICFNHKCDFVYIIFFFPVYFISQALRKEKIIYFLFFCLRFSSQLSSVQCSRCSWCIYIYIFCIHQLNLIVRCLRLLTYYISKMIRVVMYMCSSLYLCDGISLCFLFLIYFFDAPAVTQWYLMVSAVFLLYFIFFIF